MKYAELHDGTILEFPDDTSDEVMQASVKKYLSGGGDAAQETKKTWLHSPSESKTEQNIKTALASIADPLAKFITGKTQEQIETPYSSFKEAVPDIARVAPFLAAPMTGGMSLPAEIAVNAGINAASEGIASKAEGRPTQESLMRAGESGAIGGAATGVLGGLGKAISELASKAKPGIESTGSKIGSALSSADEKNYKIALENALKGKSIFGKNANEDAQIASDLYSKAIQGSRKLASSLGKEARSNLAKLKDNPETKIFDSGPVLDSLNDKLSELEVSGGKSMLSKDELEKIKEIKQQISDLHGQPIDVAYADKNKLDRTIKWNEKNLLPDSSGHLNYVLTGVSNDINSQVADKAPELFQANKNFSHQRKINNFLRRTIDNPETGEAAFFRKIDKETPTYKALKKIDEKLPEDDKFLEEAKNLIARKQFRSIFPGFGGGFGSHSGAANFARGEATGLAYAALGPELGTIAASAFSPAAHKAGLVALSKVASAANSPLTKTLLELASKEAPPSVVRLDDGTLIPQKYSSKVRRP